MLPIIFGMSGQELTGDERAFFKEANPFGFILFRRNIDSPEQVKKLTSQLREISGRDDVPILIDQEGGRVQRLRPPHWVDMSDMRTLGDLFAVHALMGMQLVEMHARVIAAQLNELGINTVCAPVLDVPVAGAHDVIGRRAFSQDVNAVIPLGATMAKTYLACGIAPIIKHLPGHGRAEADSHDACPIVTASRETLDEQDFKAFQGVTQQVGAEKLWSMTAHITFKALDDEPVSVSKTAIDVLRNDLGIIGPIIPDAVEMEALGGTLAQRALATIRAGCDASMHCTGDFNDMQKIAAVLPAMTKTALNRFEKAEMARQKDVIETNWRDLYERLQQNIAIQDEDAYAAHQALTVA